MFQRLSRDASPHLCALCLLRNIRRRTCTRLGEWDLCIPHALWVLGKKNDKVLADGSVPFPTHRAKTNRKSL